MAAYGPEQVDKWRNHYAKAERAAGELSAEGRKALGEAFRTSDRDAMRRLTEDVAFGGILEDVFNELVDDLSARDHYWSRL